jgi:hypothetical protein
MLTWFLLFNPSEITLEPICQTILTHIFTSAIGSPRITLLKNQLSELENHISDLY